MELFDIFFSFLVLDFPSLVSQLVWGIFYVTMSKSVYTQGLLT